MSSQASEVLVDVVGSTMIITLNRAAKRNAVNRSMAETIADALDRLDETRHLATGVITGAGGNFCAGMDLTEFVRGIRPSLPGRGFAGVTERAPAKPLIAAVEGYAYAGGFEIALNGPLAILATKRILVSSRDWHAAEAFHRQREFSEPVFDSADAMEGARAFAERRAPSWQGR